jgi:hypothetical protein
MSKVYLALKPLALSENAFASFKYLNEIEIKF